MPKTSLASTFFAQIKNVAPILSLIYCSLSAVTSGESDDSSSSNDSTEQVATIAGGVAMLIIVPTGIGLCLCTAVTYNSIRLRRLHKHHCNMIHIATKVL